MCDDANSEDALPVTKAEIALLKREIELLDRSHVRSIELLRWGFGTLITLALVFAGGNWYATKSNYDRDKYNLEQQSLSLQQSLALSQKDLALQNERLLDEMKRQIDANMATLTTSNDNQLAEIHSEATADIQNMVKSRAVEDENVRSNLNFSMANLFKTIDAAMAENTKQVNQRVTENKNANLAAISNFWSNLQSSIARDEAISLSVQGDQNVLANNAKTQKQFFQMAIGVACFAKSASDWLKASDEDGLRMSLDRLKVYLPMLVEKSAPFGISYVDHLTNIGVHLENLSEALKQPYLNNRYSDDAAWLEIQTIIFKKMVQDDRERKILPK